MDTHSNASWVAFKMSGLLLGVPGLGLAACVFLRRHADRTLNADRAQIVRLALALIGYSYTEFLVSLGLSALPRGWVMMGSGPIFLLLGLSGAVAACIGLVVVVVNGTATFRLAGAALGLGAVCMSILSGFLLLGGGVG